MRAFLALVAKLEQVALDPEFRYIFRVHPYEGPTWETELAEARECLREAQALASSPDPSDPEIPGSAVSEGTSR